MPNSTSSTRSSGVDLPINLDGIRAAQATLNGIITATPMLHDETLSKLLGVKVSLKAECLQRAGSFKIRGAFNKISSLTQSERARGVIAPSAGNHAQGVALAASLLGISSTIIMPTFAPLTKVVATRDYGAHVILEGATFDDSAAHARALSESEGFTYVHAFNDPAVIAGQGTIGLEMLEDAPDANVFVIPIGGGGLIAGIATAIKALKPNARVIGVQAAGCSAVLPSLQAGEPVQVSAAQTIADGIAVKRPGDLTLPIIKALVDDVLEVTDDEIARAIVHCGQRAKLVVEGAGAAGVAALLAGNVSLEPSDQVCVILCGGNIDGNLLARVFEQVMVRQGQYVLLKLAVVDRPGSLAQLVDRVAETKANIVDIFHRRALWLAPLGKVGVELVLEVRDEQHSQDVIAHLQQSGYHLEREVQGIWPE
jgi:threonine dehydratase